MADTADITTGNLTIESLQDTHKSENNSKGINVGIGAGTDSIGKPQSGSGGVNFAKGNAESAITGEQTALLIGDGANSQVTAEHTFLKGGMIANASWELPEGEDENAAPVLVDHGQLNFTTGTLTVEDLRDYSRSSQTGAGLQVSAATTTISATDEGHRMEGMTQATIGGGNVTVGGVALDEHEDFAGLNRDIDKGKIVTLDQQTGAMNASVTFDNRMFQWSEAEGFYGWKSISEQHANLGANWQLVSTALERDFQRVSVDLMPAVARDKLVFVDGVTGGFLPFNANDHGGVLGQLPVAMGSRDVYNRQIIVFSDDSDILIQNPDMEYLPIEDHPMYATLSENRQKELAGLLYTDISGDISEATVTRHNFTNGMLNSEMDALSNGFQQTQLTLEGGERVGPVEFTLNFNPSRGGIGDFLEIASDKLSGFGLYRLGYSSGMAKQTGEFMFSVDSNRGGMKDIVFSAHSQGNILSYTGTQLYNLKVHGDTYFMSAGSPVSNAMMFDRLKEYGFQYRVSQSNQGDFVAEGLGGNRGTYIYDGTNALFSHGFEDMINTVKAPADLMMNVTDFVGLFGDGSPHSSYRCMAQTGLCGVGQR